MDGNTLPTVAQAAETYRRQLLSLTRPSLLIVDEVGFLPLDPLTSASTC
jgi:hypothetical protein